MSRDATAALIGATGGAGTTRTAVELAAVLASDGESVAVFDAAFGTQGLSDYLPGRIEPDVTAVLTEREPLSAALIEFDFAVDVPGRVACCPVRAPFERLARAKRPEAVQRFEDVIHEAGREFDRVLIDTPPVAANQAVAAAHAADRRAIVAPASTRGADAVQRTRTRLQDLGLPADTVVSVNGDLEVADAGVPETAATRVDDAPACLTDEAFGAAIAAVAETVFDCSVDLSFESGSVLDRVEGFVGR